MRLLIVEDDLEAADAMARGLAEAGHECVRRRRRRAGPARPRATASFDVMVVDRMMPQAWTACTMVETLRREGDQTPVLFLSALGEIERPGRRA